MLNPYNHLRRNYIFSLIIISIMVLSLSGCGDSDKSFFAFILSDKFSDGDIAFDSFLNIYTITNGPETLFFGIDETSLNQPEFRAFLDFPLDGSTNEDVVPVDASIRSATLEVFVDEVSFAGTVPTLLELVIFPINGLAVGDYNSPPLRFPDGSEASLQIDFFASDEGNSVLIDVTSLMHEVQRRGLPDFQVRFLLDFDADTGFVGIQDRAGVALTAPLLTVKYR